MATAKITLLGMVQWMESRGDSLFTFMTFPEGIEKSDIENTILLSGGEFEVLYSNPDFLKEAIGVWAKKWNRTFLKWIDALNVEYNPLDNYDRIEEWYTSNTGTEQATNNVTSNATSSGTSSTSNTDNSYVTAYDSDALHQDAKNESNGGATVNNTAADTTTGTNNTTSEGAETRRGRAHGNIGVTTSQQMLQAELDIAKWNLYDHIADLFIREFCIMIY